MAKRKARSSRQRFTIFKRDGFRCAYCGRTPPTVVLEIDHIIPISKGGGEDDSNIVSACFDCNRGKADGSLSNVPQPIESALAEQVERREQLTEYNRYLMKARKKEQEIIREIGKYWCDEIKPEQERGKWIVSKDRLSSISTFIQRMPAADIYGAMDIAIARIRPDMATFDADHDAWKYFCGICWKRIKQREQKVGE